MHASPHSLESEVLRAAPKPSRPKNKHAVVSKRTRTYLGVIAILAVTGIFGTMILAPNGQQLASSVAFARQPNHDRLQSVNAEGSAADVSHESYVSSTGAQTLVNGGTNLDWAKLVLIDGDWKLSEANITFMMRWTRQENGPDNWWNRNNPLNNGYGSGGGSGLGSYDNLMIAAQAAADNLRSGRYPAVVKALDRGDDADATAQAIWASPWAESHYGYGTHWSSRPYEIVSAPESAWGR